MAHHKLYQGFFNNFFWLQTYSHSWVLFNTSYKYSNCIDWLFSSCPLFLFIIKLFILCCITEQRSGGKQILQHKYNYKKIL